MLYSIGVVIQGPSVRIQRCIDFMNYRPFGRDDEEAMQKAMPSQYMTVAPGSDPTFPFDM